MTECEQAAAHQRDIQRLLQALLVALYGKPEILDSLGLELKL